MNKNLNQNFVCNKYKSEHLNKCETYCSVNKTEHRRLGISRSFYCEESRGKQICFHVETNPAAVVELSMASADDTSRTQTNKGLKHEASTLGERSQKNSENRRRLQSFDSSGEQQDVLLHLCVDLRLRGSRVLSQELCDAQDAVSLRTRNRTTSS